MATRMEDAAAGLGFSIEESEDEDGDEHGWTLSVDRGEIETAIEIMVEQCLDDQEQDQDQEQAQEDDDGSDGDAIREEVEQAMAAQQQGEPVRAGDDNIEASMESTAATDGGIDQSHDRDRTD